MQRQFIPKALKKYRSKAAYNFSWLDVGVLAIFVIIAIVSWPATPLMWYFKIAIAVLILLTGFIFVVPLSNQVRIYEKIFHFLIHKTAINKYSKKNSHLICPYKSVEENGIVKLKTGSLIRIIELKGFNLFLLHEQDQRQRIDAFQNFILKNSGSFQIYKVNLPVDLTKQESFINDLEKKWTSNKNISKKVKISKDILNKLVEQNTHVQDRYFIFINGSSNNEIDEKYRILKQPLEMAFLRPEIIKNNNDISDILNSIYINVEIQQNQKLNNYDILFKNDTKFNSNHIKINKTFIRVFGVYALPPEAYVGWIASLSTIPGVDWMINVDDYPIDKAKKKLDKVISSLEVRINRKASEEAETDAYLEAMQELNQKLNAQGESIKSLKIFVIVKSDNKKELDRISKELKTQTISSNIYISPMHNLQKDMFKEFVPSLASGLRLTPSVEIPTAGIAYGFPFLNEDHTDKKGLYLGYSDSGRNIFFDPTYIDDKRVNSNMYIFGTSGKGKSTTSKKLMKDLFLSGHRIIAIDPEREYDYLCKSVRGKWINFGTDHSSKRKNYVINPMQFLKNESDDRELLSSHLQFLEQFILTLFPEMVLREIAILKEFLIRAYANKKITDENSYLNLTPRRFPLLRDVALLIKNAVQETEDPIHKEIITHLSIYFSVFLNPRSPESKLWNNYTNFNLYSSDFIVADLQSLAESGNNRLKNAQMFLLLKMVNNFMVENKIRTEKDASDKFMVLVIDEAHLLVDAQAPFATRFMFEVVKRGRKYNAMTIVTTQSVRDFLGKNPELSDLTSGIINNCQYAFILGMRSGDIADLDESMRASGGLTEYEKEILSTADQGKCLFLLGNKNRKVMQIDVADEELLMWDKKFALKHKKIGGNR